MSIIGTGGFKGLKWSSNSWPFSPKYIYRFSTILMECKLYIQSAFPQNTARWNSIRLMLAQHLRRWANIKNDGQTGLIISRLATNQQRRLCCAITSGIMWYQEMILCRRREKRGTYMSYWPIKPGPGFIMMSLINMGYICKKSLLFKRGVLLDYLTTLEIDKWNINSYKLRKRSSTCMVHCTRT